MKCFVAGGTGVIGRRSVAMLSGAGHDVTVLSRSEDGDRIASHHGGRPVRGHLFDPDVLVTATAGHDVVINLATSIPPLNRAARRSAWATNDRIRTEGVDNLIDAAIANGIVRYVQESTTFPYVDAADHWIDETHPRAANDAEDATAHAERRTAEYSEAGGTGVVLRFGQFYDDESGHTRSQAAMARRRIDPFFGDPDAHLAIVGVPAAARAVLTAASLESGAYNVVDDDPPTRREVGDEIALHLGVGRLRRIPPSIIRRLNPASDMLMRSQRVSNEALRARTNWRPDYSGANGLASTIWEITR
jgi:nucleoside-diphosphate-sugar epimerase